MRVANRELRDSSFRFAESKSGLRLGLSPPVPATASAYVSVSVSAYMSICICVHNHIHVLVTFDVCARECLSAKRSCKNIKVTQIYSNSSDIV